MRIKAIVAYDGYNYGGWQKQPNNDSIQAHIEGILSRMHQEEVKITGAGRTDAKVHALGQVFHFEGKESIPLKTYEYCLNTQLPKDIQIQSLEYVPEDFHARFSAKQKRYDYLSTRKKRDPFAYRYKNILYTDVDVSKMKEAAKVLEGTHDFSSFSSAKIHPLKSRVRTITKAQVLEESEDIRFVFEGDGFLRYQVRMMSAMLLAIGQGKLKVEDAKKILDAKDKDILRFNAPGEGLYLVKVDYE